MKVLITGATGFKSAGSAAGFNVRLPSSHPERLGPADDAVLLPTFDAPAEAFLTLMPGVTHVVHCAALNNDGNASEADYLSVNGALTGQLAHAAAARASGRFIYLSSIRAVAGPGFGGTIDETTPLLRKTPMGARSTRARSARLKLTNHRAVRTPPCCACRRSMARA